MSDSAGSRGLDPAASDGSFTPEGSSYDRSSEGGCVPTSELVAGSFTGVCGPDGIRFSAFSLAGEIARYLNISCVLAARIIRESVDGEETILEAINLHNEVLDDIVIPRIFSTLFEVKGEAKSEAQELVLLREPKDSGYYVFNAKPELVLQRGDAQFTPDEVAKSFHADTYCFDSKPERECFMQYFMDSRVRKIYFTGVFTSNQGDLSIHYYDPESMRVRQYYPDFFAEMADGSYQLIEVKGDNMIDDAVVKAKAEAVTIMAVESGVEYRMYRGSEIMKTHILDSQMPRLI